MVERNSFEAFVPFLGMVPVTYHYNKRNEIIGYVFHEDSVTYHGQLALQDISSAVMFQLCDRHHRKVLKVAEQYS